MASSYGYLGKRGPVTGLLDTTGLNTGNWTVAFSPAILNVNISEFLIYKIQCAGALGSTFNLFIENVEWDVNVFGSQNSWHDDAGDNLVVRNGENVYLMYSDAVTDLTPPVATLFLRYDLSKFGAMGFASLWEAGLTRTYNRLRHCLRLVTWQALLMLPLFLRADHTCR